MSGFPLHLVLHYFYILVFKKNPQNYEMKMMRTDAMFFAWSFKLFHF